MKKAPIFSVLLFCCFVCFAYAGPECYMVTEDALLGDSQQTWEIANLMLKNQEMEKLTKWFLEEKIAVLKEGERIHLVTAGKMLNEIRRANDERRWFIAIEVTKPCPN